MKLIHALMLSAIITSSAHAIPRPVTDQDPTPPPPPLPPVVNPVQLNPGDIAFNVSDSPAPSSYKFRVIGQNGQAISFSTGCVTTQKGAPPVVLPVNIVNVPQDSLVIQFADCAFPIDNWVPLFGQLDYSNQGTYRVSADLVQLMYALD